MRSFARLAQLCCHLSVQPAQATLLRVLVDAGFACDATLVRVLTPPDYSAGRYHTALGGQGYSTMDGSIQRCVDRCCILDITLFSLLNPVAMIHFLQVTGFAHMVLRVMNK
jgi:hypothetical protein